MRVLHIIGDLQTGGVQMDLYKHLKTAHREGYEPEVISLTSGGVIANAIEALHIPVHIVFFRYGNMIRSFVELFRKIRHCRPDVINAQMYHAIFLVTIVSLFLKGVSVTWGIYHNSFDKHLNKKSTLIVMKLCAILSWVAPFRIVFPSDASCNLHAKAGFCKAKLVVIPNGFELPRNFNDKDTALLRIALGLPDTAVSVIGMVGRYDPLKDPESFIKAAYILLKRRKDVHFAFCGPGFTKDNSEIMALLHQFKIADTFHLLGERSDILEVMHTFTIFTLSSLAESFGNVVGEAMSVSRPCVVTDVGACSWLVGDTGRIVPPGNPNALVDAWDSLLNLREEELQQLGTRARQRIADNFSLTLTTNRYLQLFRKASQV